MSALVRGFVLGALALGGLPTTSEVHAQNIVISRSGTRTSRIGPRENFTGVVHVLPLFDSTATTRASASSVTFAPGARSAWHTHPRGQT